MIKLKQILLLGFGLFAGSSLMAQTTVAFTYDSTMSDAMVANGGVETQNFGSQTEFYVYHQQNQQIPMVFRSFIQYDISSIPQNAIVTSANLRLYPKAVNNAENHPIYIERVGGTAWDESTITWNNQPGIITADQLAFSHSQTTNTTVQEFDVTEHVQIMVSNPEVNNGWRIRLQAEQGTSTFGLVYNSSEANNTAKRPILEVTYVLPIEMETAVTHCTAGNSDGALSVFLTGGSSYGISNIYFYQTVRNLAQRGTATITNVKTTYNVQYNSSTGEITAENLDPGIYILRVFDDEYYTNSDLRLAFYKHILVGREGEVTSGILLPNHQYHENTTIAKDKATNTAPLDRANTNYHSNASSIPLRVSDAPNTYEQASLIKYNMDFDDQLEFSKAELQIRAWSGFFRHNNSSNAATYSLVTENWEESVVTWNTRPTTNPAIAVNIPTTTYIGYDPVHNYDTVSLMPFVEYWQANPAENYGFEMALTTYGATQLALRDYKSTNNNQNYVEFEFTVKNPVATTFNDTTNTGTLTVSAPTSGTLPYTYLINTEPLGTLAEVWTEIGDSTLIDSVDFFTGDVAATEFTFTGLPSGQYYVAVYDNGGTKIMDGSGVVNTAIAIYSNTDLDLSANNQVSRASAASGNGSGRLYAELLAADQWGGLTFTVETLGDFYIGFNKTSDAVASSATDLEFGIKITSQGTYQIIENNVLLAAGSTSVAATDEITLLRDHDDYVAYLNGTEIYRDQITGLAGEDASLDVVLQDGVSILKLKNYAGDLKRPAPGITVGYPDCGSFNGSITVAPGVVGTVSYCTLVNNDGTSPNPGGLFAGGTYTFPTVPLGTYTLTIGYSVDPIYPEPGYSYVIEEQIAVGYVVEWEELTHNFVMPLNTIRKGPGLYPETTWATANSTNMTLEEYPNWLQFEVDLSNGYFTSSSNRERLVLRNQYGQIIYGLETGIVAGSAVQYMSGMGVMGSSLLAPPQGVWRLEQEADNYDLFRNNVSAIGVTTDPTFAPPIYEIAIEQNGAAQYIKTIASFCNNYPIADQYIEPKREIEGGYYVVPKDDILRFEFNEEYTLNDNEGNLKYIVRDFAGTEQNYLLDDMTEIYGDNRFLLDVSALSSGVYVMEIINDKGENWFLRFKK